MVASRRRAALPRNRVATTTPQLERSSARQRVLDVVRGLLEELGSQGALPMLSSGSHLDRDLGLGSLERVELLARLETEFGVRLPDRLAAEANTPDDLTRALVDAPGADAKEIEPASALRASVTAQKLQREATQTVSAAETLLDVLRYRAVHDAERTHLLITEDVDGQDRNLTLTVACPPEAA
jgi:fatty-acyl-CoA synthase